MRHSGFGTLLSGKFVVSQKLILILQGKRRNITPNIRQNVNNKETTIHRQVNQAS